MKHCWNVSYVNSKMMSNVRRVCSWTLIFFKYQARQRLCHISDVTKNVTGDYTWEVTGAILFEKVELWMYNKLLWRRFDCLSGRLKFYNFLSSNFFLSLWCCITFLCVNLLWKRHMLCSWPFLPNHQIQK